MTLKARIIRLEERRRTPVFAELSEDELEKRLAQVRVMMNAQGDAEEFERQWYAHGWSEADLADLAALAATV
jgi:hypothetical protein